MVDGELGAVDDEWWWGYASSRPPLGGYKRRSNDVSGARREPCARGPLVRAEPILDPGASVDPPPRPPHSSMPLASTTSVSTRSLSLLVALVAIAVAIVKFSGWPRAPSPLRKQEVRPICLNPPSTALKVAISAGVSPHFAAGGCGPGQF